MKQPLAMIRGTTHTVEIYVEDPDNGGAYMLAENEVLRFGLKRRPEDKECLVTKELTSANMEGDVYVLILNPADTAALDFGTHYYDVGLQSGTTYTNVIECSEFDIRYNITASEVIN